ncbi:MAG: nitrous oxide-stimulated promoter family protein, partial [Intestinibacter sp.]
MSRIEREKHIIEVMIEIYCKKKHKSKDGLCSECRELLD